MRRNIFTLLVAFLATAFGALQAQNTVYYGYSPAGDPVPANIAATGHGNTNGHIAGAIKLDPATDPVFKRLAGKQILGVRCYVRTAYEQGFDERSGILLYEGSTDAKPIIKYADFAEGWNNVYFDSPVTISDKPIYLGFQVLELKGSPYPLVSYAKAHVPNSCFIQTEKGGKWSDNAEKRGPLMIQAILADDAKEQLANTAYSMIYEAPLSIAPSEPFPAQVYVHNISSEPLTDIEIETLGGGDTAPHTLKLHFDTPIAPYDGTTVGASVTAGSQEGALQELALTPVKVNGKQAQETMVGRTTHYVTKDAFVRIPLIEEFTSQACPNCPYMAYYLHKAMEVYGGPLAYVTHHSGFREDSFTSQVDRDMLYMFGGAANEANPAAMYDRTILKGQSQLVLGAFNEPTHENYLNLIKEIASYPAMAKVIVDAEETGGKLKCRVHGAANRDLVADGTPIYLSAYLIEDGLSIEDFPQDGLDVDDAPADLKSSFKHNGIIRHNFSVNPMGDKVTFADDNTFSVDLPEIEYDSKWVKKNCHVVAFLHYIDKNDLSKNKVLNAGGTNFNGTVSGIESTLTTEASALKCFVGADGCLKLSRPVSELRLYGVGGQMLDPSLPLSSGAYIVVMTGNDGKTVSQKLLVD